MAPADQEQRGLRFVYEQLLPALAANNNIQHVLLNQWPPVQVVPIDPSGVAEIGVDHLLANLVAQRYLQIAMIHQSLIAVRDSSEQVMSAIAKSIE